MPPGDKPRRHLQFVLLLLVLVLGLEHDVDLQQIAAEMARGEAYTRPASRRLAMAAESSPSSDRIASVSAPSSGGDRR